nr:GAK system XXXCH domain-containing protein [Desulfobulbaceae bacterium]
MGSREIKFERTVSAADVTSFFRAIANSIEGVSPELEDYGIDLNTAKKIAIEIKKGGDQFTLKIKAKYPDLLDAPGVQTGTTVGSGRPPYKYLKKRMKGAFKSIGNSLLAGEIPNDTTVGQFLDDSEVMVTYPGRGDEFYERYTAACREFSSAFESGKLEELSDKFTLLTKLKEECHGQYK